MSDLILSIKQRSREQLATYDKRENERLPAKPDLFLDMRLPDGSMLCVTIQNVSQAGIALLSRERVRLNERIQLRLADADRDAPFEDFEVLHVTAEKDRFLIGATRRDPTVD
jgi:hypothetical protein